MSTNLGAHQPLGQLNSTHADILTNFLEALRNTNSSNITGSIPAEQHAHGNTTTFTLADLVNTLANITIVSADIPDDITTPGRTEGYFNSGTNTLTLGTHLTDYADIIDTVIHESLHAYIFSIPSLDVVVSHGTFGAEQQAHQAWFQAIVDDLIAQLEAQVGDLENHANCS